MAWSDIYYVTGTAYAGKSTMVRLLAERHGGVECGENWHDVLTPELEPAAFPCLTWMRDLADWHDFVRRTPDEYEAWVTGATRECEALELRLLEDLSRQDRKVFVDTNIRVETLRRIAAPGHVLVMLADPEVSVGRFFERPDREKQFLYRLMLEEPDPEASLANFRECLKRVNSPAICERFLRAGFPVIRRDEGRSVEATLAMVEEIFGLR